MQAVIGPFGECSRIFLLGAQGGLNELMILRSLHSTPQTAATIATLLRMTRSPSLSPELHPESTSTPPPPHSQVQS